MPVPLPSTRYSLLGVRTSSSTRFRRPPVSRSLYAPPPPPRSCSGSSVACCLVAQLLIVRSVAGRARVCRPRGRDLPRARGSVEVMWAVVPARRARRAARLHLARDPGPAARRARPPRRGGGRSDDGAPVRGGRPSRSPACTSCSARSSASPAPGWAAATTGPSATATGSRRSSRPDLIVEVSSSLSRVDPAPRAHRDARRRVAAPRPSPASADAAACCAWPGSASRSASPRRCSAASR